MRTKQSNRRTGDAGEQAAADHLRARGYRILERNYRCRAGEIDIIAEDRGRIAFVEVKTRSPRAVMPPRSAVDAEKEHRIRKAARFYLGSYHDPSPVRFDVVSVWVDESLAVEKIEVEQDAFRDR